MWVVNNFNCRGFGPLLEDKLCLIFKLAPSVCRMTFPILASLLVRLVVLLPFQLLRLSLATPSRWTPLALSVFLHCVVDRKSGSAGMPRPISYAVHRYLHSFPTRRSSDLFGPLLEDKLCLIFKLAPSVCRMTFPILASLLVRLVVLLPFQLLRLSLATPSRWTPLALSVFLHCV